MAAIFRDLARLFGIGSHPSGGAAGDVWWRTDRSQAHASDGGTTPLVLGPTGNLPAFRGGGWHPLPAYGPLTSLSTVANRAYALSLWPGRSCTWQSVAVEQLGASTGNLRAGLYEDADAVPGNLIQDFGTVSASTSGVKTWSLSPQLALRPVLYWLVVVAQTSTAAVVRARDTWDPIIGENSPLLASRNAYYREGVTGALPATFGAIAAASVGPMAVLQLT